MAVFEPKSVLALLRNSSLVLTSEREKFQTDWTNSVARRVKAWSDLPSQKKNPRPSFQLRWEAEVIEYVNVLWQKTRSRKKNGNEPSAIPLDVPFLGPRFVPPTYLHSQKRPSLSTITPEMQYIKPINIIHPLYYPQLTCCPQCSSSEKVSWEGWTATGARELHGLSQEEVALGLQLRCSSCKARKADEMQRDTTESEDLIEVKSDESSTSYCFATTNAVYWRSWDHWKIPRGIPIFFHRCALTRELFDLIVEFRPSSTSGAIEEQLKQLHLLEYQRRAFEYLEQLQCETSKPKTIAAYFGKDSHRLEAFSSFSDPQGYAGRSISDEMISEVYLAFVSRTRQQESESYLRTLTAICGSLDSTFKVSNKASLTDKDCQRSKHLKGGILSILNEENQIISWRFCQSKSNAEIMEVLGGLKRRLELLGHPPPEMMVSDNCCSVRNAVLAVFPQVESIQDVWHFTARYLATIMNASRNPLRSAVMADITNAILKRHAKDGDGAEYWNRAEQEERLVAAYEKWSTNGDVWSAASLKVHQEQLKHVRKGCLERRRQDVLSDGSRIEGCHKAWNSLQRAQPSGLVMLTALSHDFVLRRNVRIAFNSEKVDPFIASTYGSHHIHLTGAIAQLFNQLRQLSPPGHGSQSASVLPTLRVADSGEIFGLVESEHSSTFGGLLKEESTDSVISPSVLIHPSLESDDSDIAERALRISRDVLFNEWQIDPKLLNEPANAHTATKPAAVAALPHHLPTPSTSGLKSEPSSAPSPTITATDSTLALDTATILEQTAKSDTLPSTTSNSKSFGGHHGGPQPTLDDFFRVSACSDTVITSPRSDMAVDGCVAEKAPKSRTFKLDALAAGQSKLLSQQDVRSLTTATVSTSSANLSVRRVQCTAGQTRSQQLFSLATGIAPESLSIQGKEEFYLFMDMRAEYGWISYQMTSRKWVEATAEYNRRLVLKSGPTVIKKNPQALLQMLGRIEPRLIERISKDNYKSRQNSEAFWRRHCSVIQLIKADIGGKKPRKIPICNRCQTIMYPGPEKASSNHKRGVCADGVSTRPKDDGEPLPPWPQPKGVFSGGTTFHTNTFLTTVKRVYDQFIAGEPPGTGEQALLILEAQAFANMLQARTTIVSDSNTASKPSIALFKLYTGFAADGSTPDSHVIKQDGAKWLRISYLEENSGSDIGK